MPASRRRWRRPLLGGLAAVAVFLLLVRYGVPAFVPSAIIYAPNAEVAVDAAADPGPQALRELGVAHALRVAAGPPPASISVWVIDPPAGTAPAPAVLLLHGIRDSKSSLLWWGKRVAAAGLRAVLVDLRGHGRSSGQWLTYGVVDRRDLSQVIDALVERGLVTPPVGVLGHSYGAATAIQLAADDRRVGAVVAVSSFTSLSEIVPIYVRRNLWWFAGLVPRARLDQAVAEAGRQAQFDPQAASPLAAIRRVTAHSSVLLVHGADDRNIPPAHSVALHAAAPGSRLMIVPGEGHNSIMADRSGALARAGVGWLRGHLVRAR